MPKFALEVWWLVLAIQFVLNEARTQKLIKFYTHSMDFFWF